MAQLMRNLTQKKKVKTYKPTIHLSMYNLINKPILSTMMIAFCLSLISLGSMSRERGRRGEGGVGGGLGSEARMKRKDEKRKSLPPWHSGAATISQTGRGTKRLQAIFGLSLQSKYKKKKNKSHSAHFQKILNPFVRHLQLVYFWSLWGFRPRLE